MECVFHPLVLMGNQKGPELILCFKGSRLVDAVVAIREKYRSIDFVGDIRVIRFFFISIALKEYRLGYFRWGWYFDLFEIMVVLLELFQGFPNPMGADTVLGMGGRCLPRGKGTT